MAGLVSKRYCKIEWDLLSILYWYVGFLASEIVTTDVIDTLIDLQELDIDYAIA